MSVFAGPIHVTGMESCEFTYEWTIKNYEQLYGGFESPIFSSHYGDFDDKWTLKIYLDKINNYCRNTYIEADLKLQSFNNNTTSQLQTKCKILINDKYEKTEEYTFSKFSETSVYGKSISPLELSKTANGLKNELKICCTITMTKKTTNNSNDISTINARQQLSEDWKQLLLNEKSADVTIQVGQKSFRAIKGILGVRSPVFSAMFDHEEFKENEKNEVVIDDIEEDVFEEFLHYIYTGESSRIDKMAMELLAVADKYQVDCLKNICEEVICKTINVDNVASILVCSDKYNLKKLNQKCLEFMKKNLEAVISNKTFQVYKKKYSEIFVDVLEHLLMS